MGQPTFIRDIKWHIERGEIAILWHFGHRPLLLLSLRYTQ